MPSIDALASSQKAYPVQAGGILSSLFSKRYDHYHQIASLSTTSRHQIKQVIAYIKATEDLDIVALQSPRIEEIIPAEVADLLLLFADGSFAFLHPGCFLLVHDRFRILDPAYIWPLTWRPDSSNLTVQATSRNLKKVPQPSETARLSGHELLDVVASAWRDGNGDPYISSTFGGRSWTDTDTAEIKEITRHMCAAFFPDHLTDVRIQAACPEGPVCLTIGITHDTNLAFTNYPDLNRAWLWMLDRIKPVMGFSGYDWEYCKGPTDRQSSYRKSSADIMDQFFGPFSAHEALAAHAALLDYGISQDEIEDLAELIRHHVPAR